VLVEEEIEAVMRALLLTIDRFSWTAGWPVAARGDADAADETRKS